MTLTAKYVFKKETKGAVQFEEVDANGKPTVNVSGAMYLRKSALQGAVPKEITVTVTVA